MNEMFMNEMVIEEMFLALTWGLLGGTCSVIAADGVLLEKGADQAGTWKKWKLAGILCGMWFFLFVKCGAGLPLCRIWGMLCILFPAAVSDAAFRVIPGYFIRLAGVWWILTIPAAEVSAARQWGSGLVGAICIGGGVFLLSFFLSRYFRKKCMGGSDCRLFFLTGFCLGAEAGLYHLFLSCVFGLMTVFFTGKKEIAFGPAIIAAFLAVLPVMSMGLGKI